MYFSSHLCGLQFCGWTGSYGVFEIQTWDFAEDDFVMVWFLNDSERYIIEA